MADYLSVLIEIWPIIHFNIMKWSFARHNTPLYTSIEIDPRQEMCPFYTVASTKYDIIITYSHVGAIIAPAPHVTL